MKLQITSEQVGSRPYLGSTQVNQIYCHKDTRSSIRRINPAIVPKACTTKYELKSFAHNGVEQSAKRTTNIRKLYQFCGLIVNLMYTCMYTCKHVMCPCMHVSVCMCHIVFTDVSYLLSVNSLIQVMFAIIMYRT